MSTDETVRVTPPPTGGGDLTPALLAKDVWDDSDLAAVGIPVIDIPFVTVGAGIGSFVTVDYLRIAGVPASSIKVLGNNETPWSTYEYLTRNSQIPRNERLRSDSASCPDCIWGFPSYAIREAWSAKGLRAKLAPLWNVLTEPILSDYWTPRAGQVFESLEKEAARIGYYECLEKGLVRVVRRRNGGGYFTILTPPAGTSPTKRVAYRSRFVHVAVGYPGLKFLQDLQDYRDTYQDYASVVNAYEPHEGLYAELLRRPTTVVIRGSGIVASRILQRLIDDRDRHGSQTTIVHVFRTYVTGSHGPSIFMRRRGGDGWAYQGFNYPKSVWGGQLKSRMRRLEGEDRAALYKTIGGTNTPVRSLWQEQQSRGRKEGWYRTVTGTVQSVVPAGDGTGGGTVTRIMTDQGVLELQAGYVIDCTGLEADIGEHRLFADLLEHTGAGRNPLGRLDVERTFEVRGTANGDGRLYASGTATLGGYFPGVDTFLGLQIAAQEIADDLARQGFGKRIGPVRSVVQWLRWARGKAV
ncbi:hypothetical protein FB382_001263 [Nocardioides ginsengisegetis]|uniref:Uncharacterized protein n=1 Tax=Nocardioides ginsengisegetis TaxID=661491 RepID=A0A7W3IYF9_9ACTN|nr:hypothetical protein [Nocardioides ginsengisegetis]MBA8802972.1 hypothetical protein [Nocardioides ginsengisegetis]